jgi:ribosome maturation factor RimP
MMTVQDRVHELLAPIVATLDVELVDVEFTGGTLRVIVDSESNENPDDGITTKALADVNRLISPILDQHDPVPGRYTLEVSSPGLERPLKRTGHYQRAVGEQIVVKLAASSDPRRVKGRLLEVGVPADAATDPDAATDAEIVIEAVEIDGIELDEPEERRISTSDVATARTVFDWGPSPKPGKSRKKSTAKNTSKKSSPQKKKQQKKGSSTPGTSQEEVRDEQ